MLASADLDEILTWQPAVAWAGESADEVELHLGWWRSDFVGNYGGIALLEPLALRMPCAVYEAAREAARLVQAEKRSTDASPHRLSSLPAWPRLSPSPDGLGSTSSNSVRKILQLEEGEGAPR